jgi:16S rRNA (cytosine967-C5)-methyltransferase
MNVYTARDIAVEALRDRGGNVTAHLDRLIGQSVLSPADRSLARELALGVLRRRETLRTVIRAFLRQPNHTMPGPVNEILLLGAYQILFLERIPDFAAVNEAVEQADRFHHRRQQGFVNGLLRSITREIGPVETGPFVPAGDVLPMTPDSWRRLKRPIFADPQRMPQRYIADAFSLPIDLAEKWHAQFGMKTTINLAFHANSRAPMILRVNTLKTTVAKAIESLAASGLEAQPHANGLSIVARDGVNMLAGDEFKAGLLQPQDPTATQVSLALDPRPGMNVLDFCAAPGTKTTHIAELMADKGSITALDVSEDKRLRITENARRMGIGIINVMPSEAAGGLEIGSFDRVLVDVPCSNTGVLARRPEARWRFDLRSLNQVAADQRTLASMAVMFTRPGGRLVYSTCSIEQEENQQNVRWLLQKHRNLELIKDELTLPGGASDATQWHDGGYYAIFALR